MSLKYDPGWVQARKRLEHTNKLACVFWHVKLITFDKLTYHVSLRINDLDD